MKTLNNTSRTLVEVPKDDMLRSDKQYGFRQDKMTEKYMWPT